MQLIVPLHVLQNLVKLSVSCHHSEKTIEMVKFHSTSPIRKQIKGQNLMN